MDYASMSLAELKELCSGLEVSGDKRRKQTYVDALVAADSIPMFEIETVSVDSAEPAEVAQSSSMEEELPTGVDAEAAPQVSREIHPYVRVVGMGLALIWCSPQLCIEAFTQFATTLRMGLPLLVPSSRLWLMGVLVGVVRYMRALMGRIGAMERGLEGSHVHSFRRFLSWQLPNLLSPLSLLPLPSQPWLSRSSSR